MSYLGNFRNQIQIKLKSKEDEEKKKELKNKPENIAKNTDINSVVKSSEKTTTNNETINTPNNVVTKTTTNNDKKGTQNLVTGPADLEATIEDNPEEKLRELQERYELLEFYDVPASLGLETKQVPEYNEQDVRKKLEAELKQKYQDKKTDIDENYAQDLRDLQSQKQNIISSGEQTKKEINSIYDEQSLAVESQAIKRGLARSSIVLGELASVESKRAEELSNNLYDINSRLEKLESEISSIIVGRDNALNNLDIVYADELEAELQKSLDDYNKAVEEATKFNNEVKKLEAEYKIKYENAKADYKEHILELSKYGYDEYRTKLNQAKYNYMVSYLNQFDKNEAYNRFIRNSNFRKLLGDEYYQDILDYLNNRVI